MKDRELMFMIPLMLVLTMFLYSPMGYNFTEKQIQKIPKRSNIGFNYAEMLKEQGIEIEVKN